MEPDRAEAMARRLERTARRIGTAREGRALLDRAFRVSMEPRRRQLTDDHHPDFLHPARTALILMDDARVREPRTLVAGVFLETRDPSFVVPASRVARLSAGAAALLQAIPRPDQEAERLLESLLALSGPAFLVAAAERLDHARHLHLRERAEWGPYHRTTCAAYSAVARRHGGILADRLDWWCTTFADRFLPS